MTLALMLARIMNSQLYLGFNIELAITRAVIKSIIDFTDDLKNRTRKPPIEGIRNPTRPSLFAEHHYTKKAFLAEAYHSSYVWYLSRYVGKHVSSMSTHTREWKSSFCLGNFTDP